MSRETASGPGIETTRSFHPQSTQRMSAQKAMHTPSCVRYVILVTVTEKSGVGPQLRSNGPIDLAVVSAQIRTVNHA